MYSESIVMKYKCYLSRVTCKLNSFNESVSGIENDQKKIAYKVFFL